MLASLGVGQRPRVPSSVGNRHCSWQPTLGGETLRMAGQAVSGLGVGVLPGYPQLQAGSETAGGGWLLSTWVKGTTSVTDGVRMPLSAPWTGPSFLDACLPG